ncbi:hypothetical protein AMJ49_04525 [Parcubacteria bacterium DG_74_2]|nr:MAG: hypothetical protein AMJ49_04525 [Parcubacteria bacterium DG_74_2]
MIQEISLFSVFFGGIASLSIGSYVLLKDSRSLLNQLFFLMNLMLGIGGIGFGFSIITATINLEVALFMMKIAWSGVFGAAPFLFHMCWVITKNQKIFKRIFYLPLILSIFCIFTSCPFFFKGGAFMIDITFFRIYFLLYSLPLMFWGIILLIKRYSKTNIIREKNLIKYFLAGASIGIFGSFFTSISPILFGIINVLSRSIAWTFLGIGNLVIGLGILRYKIFIDFREILDTIFKTLVDLVIITDNKGIIGLVNQVALDKLKYKEQDLIGKDMQDIIKNGKERWQDVFQKLKQKDIISGQEIHFLTKGNKEIPFLLDASLIKVKGKTTGIINIGKEVADMVSYREELESEVEKRTKEIQERVDELERFYKLTVGRELRMVELKQEIKKLKERLEKEKEIQT